MRRQGLDRSVEALFAFLMGGADVTRSANRALPSMLEKNPDTEHAECRSAIDGVA
jgi:hypothetical protein